MTAPIPKLSLRYAYALHLLATKGEMYSSQLAKLMGINPINISNMVNSLEPKGFITFEHKKVRRNLLWISVTDKGKELAESIRGFFA